MPYNQNSANKRLFRSDILTVGAKPTYETTTVRLLTFIRMVEENHLPNNVINKLQLVGTPERIAEVFSKIRFYDEEWSDEERKRVEREAIRFPHTIDFRKITPMPPWVYNGPLGDKEIEKYGEENCWYDWCSNNWGTKWNAYDQPDKRNDRDIIYFTTAWESPIGLIRKLSWMFPDVEMELSWAEEMIGENSGITRFKDGEVLDEFVPDDDSYESKALYFEITKENPADHDMTDDYQYVDEELNIVNLAQRYDVNIANEALSDFKEYLYSSPLVAYKHEVGIKIYEVLQEIFRHDHEVLLPGSMLFRGRTHHSTSKPFRPEEMWNPPDGVSSHGRYNSVGVSVLYCSDDADDIPFELFPTVNEVIDVASLRVNMAMKLLDMGKLYRQFKGFVDEQNTESTALKKAYLLTNFIRDCCYVTGYNGVVYPAVNSDGTNYALFNFTRDRELTIEEVTTMHLMIDYQIRRRKK